MMEKSLQTESSLESQLSVTSKEIIDIHPQEPFVQKGLIELLKSYSKKPVSGKSDWFDVVH